MTAYKEKYRQNDEVCSEKNILWLSPMVSLKSTPSDKVIIHFRKIIVFRIKIHFVVTNFKTKPFIYLWCLYMLGKQFLKAAHKEFIDRENWYCMDCTCSSKVQPCHTTSRWFYLRITLTVHVSVDYTAAYTLIHWVGISVDQTTGMLIVETDRDPSNILQIITTYKHL